MLISSEYQEQNAELHRKNAYYGTSSGKWVDVVMQLVNRKGARSVLDYGCGKGDLGRGLSFPIAEYDPSIPGKDSRPEAADLVVCTDVLEHIEPECLDAVLDDLKALTRKAVFLSVATRPAKKTLPDGRNAHLIIKPAEWWLPKLMDRFAMVQFNRLGDGEFMFIGEAKCVDDKSTY